MAVRSGFYFYTFLIEMKLPKFPKDLRFAEVVYWAILYNSSIEYNAKTSHELIRLQNEFIGRTMRDITDEELEMLIDDLLGDLSDDK